MYKLYLYISHKGGVSLGLSIENIVRLLYVFIVGLSVGNKVLYFGTCNFINNKQFLEQFTVICCLNRLFPNAKQLNVQLGLHIFISVIRRPTNLE